MGRRSSIPFDTWTRGDATPAEPHVTVPPMAISESQLASVLDTAVDGIIVIDEAGRILMYNKACERLFGYSVTEALGQNVTVIMPVEYAREHDQYLADYLDTGTRKIIGIGREVKGRHRDGTVFPIHLSVGEASTPGGRQFIGIMRDLRAREESEQRLKELQTNLVRMARVSAIDEMGAALAHELNQPLTALMLYLQAVERACAKMSTAMPTSVMAILEKAVREAERAGSIIQRMRQLLRKTDFVSVPLALNDLTVSTIDLVANDAHLHGVSIEFLPAPALPAAYGDVVQIQQVILNLLTNAITASANGGGGARKVTLRTSPQNASSVELAVHDSGNGIAEADMGRLFEPFFTTKPDGLGLGLTISKTIIEAHGGRLLAENDPAGGATFRVHLRTGPVNAT